MISVSEVLSKGWEIFQNNVPVCIITTIFSFGVVFVPALGFQLIFAVLPDSGFLFLASTLVQQVINVCLTAVVAVVTLTVYLKLVRGEQVEIDDIVANMDKVLPVFAVSILTSIGTFIGMLLLIVPGIIFAILAVFSAWFVVDQNMGIVEAIKASIAATSSHKMSLFFFFVASMVCMIAAMIPCGLGLFVAVPVLSCGMALIYEQIR
jgi:uncharacterized membrane protein